MSDEPVVYEAAVIRLMRAEGLRAIRKHGIHNTPADPLMTEGQRLAVLTEEVGEVARAINEAYLGTPGDHDAELVKELIQVGAVAMLWLEGLWQEHRPAHDAIAALLAEPVEATP